MPYLWLTLVTMMSLEVGRVGVRNVGEHAAFSKICLLQAWN